MTQKATIPTSKTIANYIKANSPSSSKCVDADFIILNNVCVLAWIVDMPFSKAKDKGFYQALYTTYDKGKFGSVESTIPCQYCDESGKRTITTTGFIPESEKGQKSIISVLDSSDESQVKITLICQGKPHSQSLMRIGKSLTR